MKVQTRNRTDGGVWVILLCAATFITLAAVWIRQTYGILSIAMVNESFRNGLQNKRTPFVKYVILPTAIVYVILLVIHLAGKRFMRRWMTCVSAMLLIFSVCGAAVQLDAGAYLSRMNRLNHAQWYDKNDLVLHALGAVDGVTYTNAKEALEHSYQDGSRMMECDFAVTSDGQIVACHDWEFWNRESNPDKSMGEDFIPTLAFFMQSKIMGKYTPLSGDDIVLFMKEHPDLYIITDTKEAAPEKITEEFTALVEAAVRNECEETLDRMVIQIYHAYMYDIVNDIYSFPNYIYTLYQEGYRGEADKMQQYAEFCMLHDIDVITMNAAYYHEELLEICNQYRLRMYVHTVNEESAIVSYHEQGIGVYTDNL